MLFGVGNYSDAQPNRILLVTVHQVLYPMTVDVLQQVFSPHGYVEKIVTFQKSAGQIL
jgi:polypyrimidine tract-binding protein 2